MSWRSVSLAKGAVLVGGIFLLMAPRVLAGPAVRAGDANTAQRPSPPAQPAPVYRAVPVPPIVSVAVTVVRQPKKGSIEVNLRGPDGQLRRFPVEGGREAIEYQQFVLRPGQSVTIRWVAAKPRSGRVPR